MLDPNFTSIRGIADQIWQRIGSDQFDSLFNPHNPLVRKIEHVTIPEFKTQSPVARPQSISPPKSPLEKYVQRFRTMGYNVQTPTSTNQLV